MKTKLITFFSVILILYLLICTLLSFFQEKVIFFPESLDKDFSFEFDGNFEEHYVTMKDGSKLHSLLFNTTDPKGVILYLHGNAGSLEVWGTVADTFTSLGYEVFIPDYRGYGKSEGRIKNEAQLHRDMQTLYNYLKKEYSENQIIVLGHSIGSGMAARLAAKNDPKLLILQAPPYSLPHLAKKMFPLNLFPSFLIEYKLETGKYVKKANVPVAVFHGDEDEIVHYGSSLKIQQHFKPGDTLITLEGLGHNNFLHTRQYAEAIEEILANNRNEAK